MWRSFAWIRFSLFSGRISLERMDTETAFAARYSITKVLSTARAKAIVRLETRVCEEKPKKQHPDAHDHLIRRIGEEQSHQRQSYKTPPQERTSTSQFDQAGYDVLGADLIGLVPAGRAKLLKISAGLSFHCRSHFMPGYFQKRVTSASAPNKSPQLYLPQNLFQHPSRV